MGRSKRDDKYSEDYNSKKRHLKHKCHKYCRKHRGPTGPTGPCCTGPTGPTGPCCTGPTGPCCTGPTGPTGPCCTGPTGPCPIINVTREEKCSVIGFIYVQPIDGQILLKNICGELTIGYDSPGVYNVIPPIGALNVQLTLVDPKSFPLTIYSNGDLNKIKISDNLGANVDNDFMATWYGVSSLVTDIKSSCNDTHFLTCIWPTADYLYGRFVNSTGFNSISAFGVNGFEYTVNSFVIDGNEMLSTPFRYAIADSSIVPPTSWLPYAHSPILEYNGFTVFLANFSHIFTMMFDSIGLADKWYAIIAPGIDIDPNPNRIQFVWPSSVKTWSIKLIRNDGSLYTYDSIGKLSSNFWNNINSPYFYCDGGPTTISLVPTSKINCSYQLVQLAYIPVRSDFYPFIYSVNYVIVNGVFVTNIPMTDVITNKENLTLDVSKTFYTNETDLLNRVFSLYNMTYWKANTISGTSMSITYPDNVISFEIGYQRINMGIPENYVFREHGVLMGITRQFFSPDLYPDPVCLQIPL